MSLHFRKCQWGMDRAEVLAAESAELVDNSDDSLIYSDRLVGSDCLVMYKFDEVGDLVSGTYLLDSPNDVVDVADFTTLLEMLQSKYGEPDGREFDWKLPGKQPPLDDIHELARCVARGDLRLTMTWDTVDTRIRLVLTDQKAKYNAMLFLIYQSLSYIEEQQQSRRASEMDLI